MDVSSEKFVCYTLHGREFELVISINSADYFKEEKMICLQDLDFFSFLKWGEREIDWYRMRRILGVAGGPELCAFSNFRFFIFFLYRKIL